MTCNQVLSRMRRQARYYCQRIYSRNKALFYCGELRYGSRQPLGDGLGFRIIDKSAPDLKDMVARATATLPYLNPPDVSEAIEAIMERGSLLCLVHKGDVIVAHEWFTPGTNYIPWLNITLNLGSGEIYEHSAYVVESYRRKGIYRLMRILAAEQVAGRGFVKVFNAINSWHNVSLKVSEGFGFRFMGEVEYGCLAGRRYCRARMPGGRVSFMGKAALKRPDSHKEKADG